MVKTCLNSYDNPVIFEKVTNCNFFGFFVTKL